MKELEERAARLRELEAEAARAAEERKQQEAEVPEGVMALLKKKELAELGGEPVDEEDLEDAYDAIPEKEMVGATTSSVPKLNLDRRVDKDAEIAAKLTEIDERVARLAASEARVAELESMVEKRLSEADAARAANLAQLSNRWSARDVEMTALITSSVSEQISAREGELREGLKEALAEAREARRLSESTALVATMSPPETPYGGGYSFGAPQPSAWVQYYDDEAQTDYFYNTETGETSWTRPEGVIIKRGDELAAPPLFHDVDEPPVVAPGETPWLEYWDERASAILVQPDHAGGLLGGARSERRREGARGAGTRSGRYGATRTELDGSYRRPDGQGDVGQRRHGARGGAATRVQGPPRDAAHADRGGAGSKRAREERAACRERAAASLAASAAAPARGDNVGGAAILCFTANACRVRHLRQISSLLLRKCKQTTKSPTRPLSAFFSSKPRLDRSGPTTARRRRARPLHRAAVCR